MADNNYTYDVFLSYNSSDQEEVKRLSERLKAQHLNVFLDLWELRPGFPVQQKLSSALETAKAVAVVVGPNGIGRWQQVEFESAIGSQVGGSERPVIPVLLRGVSVDRVPPFLRRYNRIDFSSGREDEELARLYWGITGVKPGPIDPVEPQKPAPAPAGLTPAERAVNTLKNLLKSNNVTFFVGGRNTFSPTDSEIAGDLLKTAGLIADEEKCPRLPLDTAASYFAIQMTAAELEGHVEEMIADKPANLPPVPQALASLLLVMQKYRKPRGGSRSRHLIVTTNPDVQMERALVTQGIAFGRIVQHMGLGPLYTQSFTGISVNRGEIQFPGRESMRYDQTWREIDEALANFPKSEVDARELSLENLPEVILYKLRGSYDCYGTCALTTEQYLKFHIGAVERNLIPKKIKEIVQQTPILLLNYSYLDPDYRLASYTLLERARETTRDPIYALQTVEASSWPESSLWDRLKVTVQEDRKITTIEEEGDRFLTALRDKLQEGIA